MQRRLDLRRAGAEGLHLRAGDVPELEATVLMRELHCIAKLLYLDGKLIPIQRPKQFLLPIEIGLLQRAPFAIGPLGRIDDDTVRVQLWVGLAAQFMTELRN